MDAILSNRLLGCAVLGTALVLDLLLSLDALGAVLVEFLVLFANLVLSILSFASTAGAASCQ